MKMLQFADGENLVLTSARTAVASNGNVTDIHYTCGGMLGVSFSTGVNTISINIPMAALTRACNEGSPVVNLDLLALQQSRRLG